MGFFGTTWNILPLGGIQVGILTSLISAPCAVALGGRAGAGFAPGSAGLSRQARKLGMLLRQGERGVDRLATELSASPSLHWNRDDQLGNGPLSGVQKLKVCLFRLSE